MARSLLRLGPGSFRVILAALVVGSHLSALGIGRPAVMLFFMLSGYWVPRMYDEKYRPEVPVWLFYAARLLRIWLPFATAFLAVFAIYALSGQARPASFLTGLVLFNVASTHMDVLGTSWSLDIELQFYLLVPLIWAGLEFCQRRGYRVLPLAVTAGLVVLGWFVQLRFGGWTVLSYLPPFLAGSLIWLRKPRASGRAALVSVGWFVAVGLVACLTPYLRPFLLYGDPPPFPMDWFGMAWVMLLLPFVVWNVQQKTSALDMHLGNYSYALYITHWPVIVFMQLLLAPMGLSDKLLTLAVIAAVSISFYLGVDRPSERFRRGVIGGLSAQKLRG